MSRSLSTQPPDSVPGDARARETPALEIHDGHARLGGRTIWSGVELEVYEGQFAAILGPNGSGKTTLLRALLGELPLSEGSVSVLGRPPAASKGRIGYLPQR